MGVFKDHAMSYFNAGLPVIPIGKDKKSIVPWKQFQKAKPTKKIMLSWIEKYPDANIAIITGAVSGIAVVDIDTDQGLENIVKYLPDDPALLRTFTPRGGQHWFYNLPEGGMQCNVGAIKDCDLRADGGYVLVPPSRS